MEIQIVLTLIRFFLPEIDNPPEDSAIDDLAWNFIGHVWIRQVQPPGARQNRARWTWTNTPRVNSILIS